MGSDDHLRLRVELESAGEERWLTLYEDGGVVARIRWPDPAGVLAAIFARIARRDALAPGAMGGGGAQAPVLELIVGTSAGADDVVAVLRDAVNDLQARGLVRIDDDEGGGDDDPGESYTAPVPDGYLEKGLDDIHGARQAEAPDLPPVETIAPIERIAGARRRPPLPPIEPLAPMEPPIELGSGIASGPPASPADAPPARRRPLTPDRPEARSVQIWLCRRGVSSELAGEDDHPLDVRPDTRLAAGRSYDVQVAISVPRPETLLVTPAPSIDGLLPDSPDGHRLEVTVFGLDFALTSRAVRELWLPPAGPSQTIAFTVRAPDRLGRARLRVVVSYAGHALQAFVMTAELVRAEERAPTRVLTVTLEHAATRQFDNLAQLRPRAATAIINDDPRGGHSITLKRGNVTGTFAFTDEQIRGAAARVRTVLEAAAHAASFDEPPPLADTQDYADRVTAYHATIRTLAVYGRQLHLALLNKSDDTGKQLVRELAKTADQRLQLIHVTRSLVIPWATVYDGWLPVDFKTDGLAVCDGFVGDAPCGHGDTEHLICVRRFWGMRHDLELLLGSSVPRDAITAFQPPADRPPLRILQGARLRSEKFLPDAYTQLLAQPDVAAWTGDVYQLLEPAARPAVLVAMGHFTVDEPVPGAPVHAIDLEPVPLTDVGVSQQALTEGDWTFPHSIVLLMACSSAVAAADALSGMIDAFASAGAAAIIGTESTVYPRLSARVACAIYRRLVESNGKLSAALRELRWELARDATPLAFTFTAYGNADLAREDAT